MALLHKLRNPGVFIRLNDAPTAPLNPVALAAVESLAINILEHKRFECSTILHPILPVLRSPPKNMLLLLLAAKVL